MLHRVRIISRKKLVAFWEGHEGAQGPLEKWFRAVTGAVWKSVADIRSTFARHADPVLHWVIFNVGGDAHRIVATVNYGLGIVYIRHVFTHTEYDHWNENNRDKEAKKDQEWIEQRASEREAKTAAREEKKKGKGSKSSARKKKRKK
jgi:mRNA interferase HigB